MRALVFEGLELGLAGIAGPPRSYVMGALLFGVGVGFVDGFESAVVAGLGARRSQRVRKREEIAGVEKILLYFEDRTVPFLRRSGDRVCVACGGGGGDRELTLRRHFPDWIPDCVTDRWCLLNI